ncbi:MAG: DUF1854 domain-containing protein [Fimbriimonadaceae bacterium]|nr:DUF1854 domain-containing protein [Fimbriimonadaceae bacterium]
MVSEPLRYLEPDLVRVIPIEGAVHPRLEIEGDRTVLSARFRRIFPLSEPDAYISVQDAEGHEVGILRSLDALDRTSRDLVRSALERRYFTPPIERILDLRQDAGMWRFHVKTQRGEITFYVRNWRDSAHEVQNDRWMITSVDGLRYEIPNAEALDARSRNHLDRLA